MNRRAFLVGATGTTITLAGCNRISGSGSDKPTETAGTTSKPALGSNPDAVRSCKTSVSGTHIDWREIPVTADSIGFTFFPQGGSRESADDLIYPFKTLILVKPSKTVTVVVPKTERDHIALSYDVTREPEKLENGQRSVRFEACSDRVTQFPGRIFAEINCVRLHIWSENESEPRNVILPFFGAKCKNE
jgi:hypothetical protein